MLRRPPCVSNCTRAWTGVCLRGAWMIASVGALSVGMRSDPSELPKEVRPIEKFV